MHCLIISCVYPPEPVVTSQTSSHIANALAERGHNVTVVAPFPNRPAGRLFRGYKRKFFHRYKVNDKIDLIRCFSFLSPNSHLFSRFLENISFGISGGLIVLTKRKPDVIYSNSWPIFSNGILSLFASLRHIPFVISVQDLYPESLILQGRISESNWLIRGFRWIDSKIVRHSRAVIVISEYFSEIYKNSRGISQDKVHVIPNWIDSQKLEINEELSREYRNSKGIPDNGIVLAYAGNIGVAAGVESVIEAFSYLNDLNFLYFIIAGEGSQYRLCQSKVANIPNSRIKFHSPYLPQEESIVLGAADIFILPTRGQQSMASIPSKLLSYMLAARPIIALANPKSELANLIERSKCGWVVKYDKLAEKIREVVMFDPSERKQIGERGRKFVLQYMTNEICLPKVINIIEDAAR